MAKTPYEKLQDKLARESKTAWDKNETAVMRFSKKYMEFLSMSKTERDCASSLVRMLVAAGFKDIDAVKEPADKLYKNFNGKVVAAIVAGKDRTRFNLIGSHVDSPRIDLKPNPMFEDSSMALFKSHYYGGIKKYQWVNTPMAMHGVLFTKAGKRLEFAYGEEEGEPKFVIPDLLPHLARQQMEKPAKDFIEAEQLNIIIGSIPVDDEKIKERIKLRVLEILDKKFGIIEEDFAFAEIEFVPAYKPMDVGFDQSIIGAYGHDDKVCVFTSLMALLETKKPSASAVAYFTDKEEIGSDGNTGASSKFLWYLAEQYIQLFKLDITPLALLMNTKAVSADVGTLLNPNFPDVHERRNAGLLGNGIIIEKYTGNGGKYSANDASAEYMNYIRGVLVKAGIKWQTGELGKIDIGGGGTIAKFLASYGMDVVDAGPGVLAMHAPLELISKVDVYEAYRFYKGFFG